MAPVTKSADPQTRSTALVVASHGVMSANPNAIVSARCTPPSGLPFGLFYALTFAADTVPPDDFSAPDGLTGVWLVSQWSDTVLRWDARLGWSREDCVDGL